ncbi:MAG: rhodanese-related sulfurtransferase [Pseudomonadales bacterium]
MSQVMTFHRFAPLAGLEALRADLENRAGQMALKGTILLAEEGINGTLAGDRQALEAFADVLRAVDGFEAMPFKFSHANAGNPVFYRLKVRIKAEIVALGQPGVNPAKRTGTHVDAAAWNALLDDPEVLLIDTRNHYEVGIGTFPGAVDPGTRSFKQFPDYVASLDPASHRKVAMFCTGGIRCEKASAFMLEQGFEAVYQLDGGILRYLETVAAGENRWQGECFVFDQRVSVDDALGEGVYRQCFACRQPLTPEDADSPAYVPGVSCPHCIDSLSDEQRASFEERQRQVRLAEARGELHVGKRMPGGRLVDAAARTDQGASSGSR